MFDDFKWEIKKYKLDIIFSLVILLALVIVTLFFLLSTYADEPFRGIYVGLATGLISSSVVSIFIYLHDKHKLKLQENVLFEKYQNQLKNYIYYSLDLFDFAEISDGEYSYVDFIKIQHRWFHDYSKKMQVDNYNKNEVTKRIKQINKYVVSTFSKFMYFVKDDYKINSSGLSESNFEWIKNFIFDYVYCYDDINKNSTYSLILYFSSYLECISQISNYFKELGSFKKLKFVVNDGKITIFKEDFYKAEPFFKWLDDFTIIRDETIKKAYKNVK